MYFHTDDPRTVFFLMNVMREADEQGQSIRIDVDAHGNLKVKRGQGMWSPPLVGTPDPNRDIPSRPDLTHRAKPEVGHRPSA